MFRAAGYTTRTIDDVFGMRPVPDIEWIRFADDHDWVVACKDDRIRYNQLEKHALYMSRLRLLCLTSGQLKSAVQAEYFRSNLGRFAKLWQSDGHRPWVYAVRKDSIERLRIEPP